MNVNTERALQMIRQAIASISMPLENHNSLQQAFQTVVQDLTSLSVEDAVSKVNTDNIPKNKVK